MRRFKVTVPIEIEVEATDEQDARCEGTFRLGEMMGLLRGDGWSAARNLGIGIDEIEIKTKEKELVE